MSAFMRIVLAFAVSLGILESQSFGGSLMMSETEQKLLYEPSLNVHLQGIVWLDRERWQIWINGRSCRSSSRSLPPLSGETAAGKAAVCERVHILEVTPEHVIFSYPFDEGQEQIVLEPGQTYAYDPACAKVRLTDADDIACEDML